MHARHVLLYWPPPGTIGVGTGPFWPVHFWPAPGGRCAASPAGWASRGRVRERTTASRPIQSCTYVQVLRH